ncbi:MAG: hypothetical protein U1E05_22160, partial [Patescibacteria group bacterium]|nr:hypothetical protein [Patescibacteria group bacterium]
MDGSSRALLLAVSFACLALLATATGHAQEPRRVILPEQRQMQVRDPARIPGRRFAEMPTPQTVMAATPAERAAWNLSLDEAIQTALKNSEVIRVLGGSSGRTIYDPAVANTQIDVARGRFDPTLESNNNFYRN